MFKQSLILLTCFALITACGSKDEDKDKGKDIRGGRGAINIDDYKPAKGELKFDKYVITPPEGYVYIPEEYEESIKRMDRLFVRFFESKREAGKLGTKDNKLVLTFGLFPRRFDNVDSYYKSKPGNPEFFQKVPKKYKEVRGKGKWNCRFFDRNYNPALSCAILGSERLIKVDAVGASKKEILGKIDLVESMLESFYIYDATKEIADKEADKAVKTEVVASSEEPATEEQIEGQEQQIDEVNDTENQSETTPEN